MIYWISTALVVGGLLGWLLRHYHHVGIERALKAQTLLVKHSLHQAAGEVLGQREILRLLLRGDTERAIESLLSRIAIFYHAWHSNPELAKHSESIKLELLEIERAMESLPSLRAAIEREDSIGRKSAN